ncbi:hypothetical protein M8494_08785 [Serratia ureilytica]
MGNRAAQRRDGKGAHRPVGHLLLQGALALAGAAVRGHQWTPFHRW